MIFLRKFYVSQCRNISQRNPSVLCSRKFLLAKMFMDKKEGEVSRFSFGFFCLTMPKNAVGEHFSLIKISGIEKVWMRGMREYQDFPSKIFLSHIPEKIRGGTLYGVTDFGYRKTLCFRGLCHDFLSKIFSLTVPKPFVEEPFFAVFQKNCANEKVYG